MLKSETNTVTTARQVRDAFEGKHHRRVRDVVFDQGQWWVEESSGAQWSVVDATGPGSFNGFDFERVTPGDDE